MIRARFLPAAQHGKNNFRFKDRGRIHLSKTGWRSNNELSRIRLIFKSLLKRLAKAQRLADYFYEKALRCRLFRYILSLKKAKLKVRPLSLEHYFSLYHFRRKKSIPACGNLLTGVGFHLCVKMACHLMFPRSLRQRRLYFGASIHFLRTTGVKPAS